MSERRFGAGLSRGGDARKAAITAAEEAASTLGGERPTLAVVFATRDHAEDDAMLGAIRETLDPEHLIGCSTEAAVGGGTEAEGEAAVSVWAASLPGAEIRSFRLQTHPVADGIGVGGWPDAVDGRTEHPWTVLLLADPFTFPADGLLARINEESDTPPRVLGGMASGGSQPGDHRVMLGAESHADGAVAVAISRVPIVPVVSQGCAPVGPEMVITDAEDSAIRQLAGSPALEKIEAVVRDLDDDERALAVKGLLAGLVIDENRPDYERGDFLIRAIHGGDRESGVVRVGERVRVGQTLRLHARDAASASEDMRRALMSARPFMPHGDPGGALLFTCNGRGTRLFDEQHHDAEAVARHMGGPATVGMFCNGEIGPVGGRNFLHGFTATMALFAAGDAAGGGDW